MPLLCMVKDFAEDLGMSADEVVIANENSVRRTNQTITSGPKRTFSRFLFRDTNGRSYNICK